MEKVNKEIIKALAKKGFDEYKPFGQGVAEHLFRRKECALLCQDKHYTLILAPNADAKKSLQTLVELFSLLRYMEQEHIIYVQAGEAQEEDFIFYYGCNDIKKSTAHHGYELGEGYILKSDQGSYLIQLNDNALLSQNVNLDFLSSEVERYLCGRILPTAAINDYIAHDYLSDNDYNSKQSLRVSRSSVVVALIIACLSPIVTLWLTNRWGILTIEGTQYNTIIETIGGKASANIKKEVNTLPDSTQQKKKNNEQDSTKSL